MSLMDDMLANDAAIFTDPDSMPGSEAIGYTPLAGVQRTVNANVVRDHPEDIAEASQIGGAFIRLFMRRHATDGALSIDRDGDTYSIAPRYGGTSRNFKVVSVLNSDAGGWNLRLRGPAN